MTKLLATGDWHVGSGLDYGRTPEDRLQDQEAVINQIVDLAIEHDVDALLLAGDIWHRRRPTVAELLAVVRPLRRLRASHTCDIVAINGNHCVEATGGPVALELFEDILDVYRHPGIAQTRAGAIAMLPWTPIARLVAEHGGGARDNLNEFAADLLIAAARDLRAQTEGAATLMLHWSITGAVTPTGREVGPDFGVELPLGDLQELGFDAVVAGHIHKPQILGGENGAPIFYVGSPAPVDFGEGQSEHGCFLVDINGAGSLTELGFLPIESRAFVTVDVDLTASSHEALGLDETDAVAAAIAIHLPIDDAVVRVRYRASEGQARRIDWPKLKTLLEPAHKVFAITGDIVRADRARVSGVDEDLAPLDALSLWLRAEGLVLGENREVRQTPEAESLVLTTSRFLSEVGP